MSLRSVSRVGERIRSGMATAMIWTRQRVRTVSRVARAMPLESDANHRTHRLVHGREKHTGSERRHDDDEAVVDDCARSTTERARASTNSAALPRPSSWRPARPCPPAQLARTHCPSLQRWPHRTIVLPTCATRSGRPAMMRASHRSLLKTWPSRLCPQAPTIDDGSPMR